MSPKSFASVCHFQMCVRREFYTKVINKYFDRAFYLYFWPHRVIFFFLQFGSNRTFSSLLCPDIFPRRCFFSSSMQQRRRRSGRPIPCGGAMRAPLLREKRSDEQTSNTSRLSFSIPHRSSRHVACMLFLFLRCEVFFRILIHPISRRVVTCTPRHALESKCF